MAVEIKTFPLVMLATMTQCEPNVFFMFAGTDTNDSKWIFFKRQFYCISAISALYVHEQLYEPSSVCD